MKKKILFVIQCICLLNLLFCFSSVNSFDNQNSGNIENNEKNEIDSNVVTQMIESQSEAFNIPEFIKQSKEYTKEIYGDIDLKDIFQEAITGKINNNFIIKIIFKVLGKEVAEAIYSISTIIAIILIHSLLKTAIDSLDTNTTANKIAYYSQYILIVTVIMKNFSDIINIVRDSISNLVGFMNSLIPILITISLSTGSITFASSVQPIILYIISFVGNIISGLIIPLLLIATVISIISKISDKRQIAKISKFIRTSIVWSLGIILTIFVSVLGLEGTLAQNVDGVLVKTTKSAVTSVIPVVGKILGDCVDAVLGCSNIIKNAVGVVGVIIIIGICLVPILKVLVLMILYNLVGIVVSPIADNNIISLLEEIGQTYKVLLGILISVSVMFIIGITLVLQISNSSIMYG